MKKLVLITLSLISISAFANICEVVMVDNYSGRIVDRFREYDYDGTCREAMKECRKELRLSGWYGRADCQVSSTSPRRPDPTPDYSADATRPLQLGEVVIFNNQFATVAMIDRNNMYSVKYNDDWRSSHHQIPREYLAVTNGCLSVRGNNLCAGHQVLTRFNEYATVVGLQFDQRVIIRLQSSRGVLLDNVNPNELTIIR
jgi:hypothetical protein